VVTTLNAKSVLLEKALNSVVSGKGPCTFFKSIMQVVHFIIKAVMPLQITSRFLNLIKIELGAFPVLGLSIEDPAFISPETELRALYAEMKENLLSKLKMKSQNRKIFLNCWLNHIDCNHVLYNIYATGH
jgi:hypothetical protein